MKRLQKNKNHAIETQTIYKRSLSFFITGGWNFLIYLNLYVKKDETKQKHVIFKGRRLW